MSTDFEDHSNSDSTLASMLHEGYRVFLPSSSVVLAMLTLLSSSSTPTSEVAGTAASTPTSTFSERVRRVRALVIQGGLVLPSDRVASDFEARLVQWSKVSERWSTNGATNRDKFEKLIKESNGGFLNA